MCPPVAVETSYIFVMRKKLSILLNWDQSVQEKNIVVSLQKGLDVLTCFGRQHNRLTVSKVAWLTDV